MAYVTGLFVIDAPASALNNHGAEAGARTDNTIAVKKIRTPQGTYPYVSAQAVRYWLRTTLERAGNGWVSAPVFREGKIAYTDANPVSNWDDDLLGYMRAPSKRDDAAKDAAATPLEKGREITRVSPLRVGTMVAIAPSLFGVNHFCLSRQSFLSVVARLKGSFHPITSRVAAAIFRFGPPAVGFSFPEERL